MKEVISIIVPIYGVEKYIRRFLESIENQTYKELEIILVDDESPDKSGIICEEFAEKDGRIKVIHKRNMGAAAARNTGLDFATGEYISFLDPDDFIAPNMFEKMANEIKRNNADICICNFETFKEDEEANVIQYNFDEIEVKKLKTDNEMIQYMFLEKYVDSILLWNKLYKRKLWDNVRIPEIRAYEDEAITYKVLESACKIVYVNAKLYYYMIRKKGSITSQDFSEKRLLRLDILSERIEHYSSQKRWRYFNEMLFVYKTELLQVMELIEKNSKFSFELLKKYFKLYRRYCLKYLLYHEKNYKNIVTYFWFAIFPKEYFRRFCNKKNKGIIFIGRVG